MLVSRYSAVRRQFGPTPDKEVPVLEYQLQVSKFFCSSREMVVLYCLCLSLPVMVFPSLSLSVFPSLSWSSLLCHGLLFSVSLCLPFSVMVFPSLSWSSLLCLSLSSLLCLSLSSLLCHTQQHRLLPYLSTAIVFSQFTASFYTDFMKYTVAKLFGEEQVYTL